jgi:hypothetical protein
LNFPSIYFNFILQNVTTTGTLFLCSIFFMKLHKCNFHSKNHMSSSHCYYLCAFWGHRFNEQKFSSRKESWNLFASLFCTFNLIRMNVVKGLNFLSKHFHMYSRIIADEIKKKSLLMEMRFLVGCILINTYIWEDYVLFRARKNTSVMKMM